MNYWIDALGISGACLLTAGVALIYIPAGVMVAGILLLGGAILAARRVSK